MRALAAPTASAESAAEVFEQVLAHEQQVSHAVEELVTLCRSRSDYASEDLMMQYVREQVEEESEAADIVDCLRLAAQHPAALLRIDRRLGKRRSCKHRRLWGEV